MRKMAKISNQLSVEKNISSTSPIPYLKRQQECFHKAW